MNSKIAEAYVQLPWNKKDIADFKCKQSKVIQTYSPLDETVNEQKQIVSTVVQKNRDNVCNSIAKSLNYRQQSE